MTDVDIHQAPRDCHYATTSLVVKYILNLFSEKSYYAFEGRLMMPY